MTSALIAQEERMQNKSLSQSVQLFWLQPKC